MITIKDLHAHQIQLVVDITATTATFTVIGDNINTFKYDFKIHNVYLYAETNALARILLRFNNHLIFPTENYVIDDTPTNKTDNNVDNADNGYYVTTTPLKYKLDLELKRDWNLEILAINGHSSAQKVYIILQGHKTYTSKKEEEVCPIAEK